LSGAGDLALATQARWQRAAGPAGRYRAAPGTTHPAHLGERADADGRALLHNLTAWKLWAPAGGDE